MDEITFRSAKQVFFGTGVRRQVGECASISGESALIVCGRKSLQASGALEELRGYLSDAGVATGVFAEVEVEPSLATVERGREVFREQGHSLVIAAGGGSALDVGKAVAGLAGHDGPVTHETEVTDPGAPCIALPTTSGTGAEVTPNSVLTDTETGKKASIRGHALLPEFALVDPELTVSCPSDQTAHSGLDALAQAIEAYVSTGANAISDPLAEEATRRIAAGLRDAVADGSDLCAREGMALGSLLAGFALASARLGLIHGLAHPLGSLYHLPHGLVCGALLPYVVEYNIDAASDRYAHLAREIDAGRDADDLLAWLRTLVADLGADIDFAEAGLTRDDFDRILPPTLSSGSSAHNPRPIDEESVRRLLERLIAQ